MKTLTAFETVLHPTSTDWGTGRVRVVVSGGHYLLSLEGVVLGQRREIQLTGEEAEAIMALLSAALNAEQARTRVKEGA